MHDACLVPMRKGRLNRLRCAFQAVRDGDEDVIHVAILLAAEDAGAESCASVFCRSHGENLASAVDSYADGRMLGHVPDAGAVADHGADCTEEGDGVDALKRAVPPLAHVVEHAVRHDAHIVRTDVDSVEMSDERLDVAGATARECIVTITGSIGRHGPGHGQESLC